MTSPLPQSDDNPDQQDGLGETLRTIVMAIVIAMCIRTLAFEPFNIPSSSMVPDLLIGDYLFVSKFSYGYGSKGTFWGVLPFSGRIFSRDPKRGDVIVFKLPRDGKTDYIKRLIGLPGDTVQMRQGLLYINGVPVQLQKLATPVSEPGEEPSQGVTDYLERLPNGVTHVIRKMGEDEPLDNTEIFEVPPHSYFFMGDNRDNSQDSRTVNVGFVPEENLVGRAEILFFSLDENAHFWEVWKWPWAVRWDRLFKKIN